MNSGLIIVSLLAMVAAADVKMTNPVPFGKSTLKSSSLLMDGSDFPCQLREGVYDYEGAQNIYAQGSTQHLAFIGSAVRGGGSCQVSITTDLQPNKTSVWKVIKSIEGGCPAKNQPGNMGNDPSFVVPDTYNFTIPSELSPGSYTLAWTWFNKGGSQNMYMNCAPITVTGLGGGSMDPGSSEGSGGSGSSDNSGIQSNPGGSSGSPDLGGSTSLGSPGGSTAPAGGSKASGGSGNLKSFFDSLPAMFVANIHYGSACRTVDNANLVFPDPGAFVDKNNPQDFFSPPKSCVSPASTSRTSSIILRPIEPKLTLIPITRSVPFGSVTRLLRLLKARSPFTVTSAATSPVSRSMADAVLPASAPCANEGDWKCIGGDSVQRCTKGTWSSITPLGKGIECVTGQSSEIHLVPSRRSKQALRDLFRSTSYA